MSIHFLLTFLSSSLIIFHVFLSVCLSFSACLSVWHSLSFFLPRAASVFHTKPEPLEVELFKVATTLKKWCTGSLWKLARCASAISSQILKSHYWIYPPRLPPSVLSVAIIPSVSKAETNIFHSPRLCVYLFHVCSFQRPVVNTNHLLNRM